jgi:citrate lyase subunit beta/citryl-CoA lyase
MCRGDGRALRHATHRPIRPRRSLNLADAAGFAAVCRQGRGFGFDGKTLIRPMQIEAANAAFAPGVEEVAWSRRVIPAHAAAEARGEGAVLVDGRLVETLHVEQAHQVLTLAAAIERMAAGGAPGRASVDSPAAAV